MILVGCDLHTRKQQVALLNTDTGELWDQELSHAGDDDCVIGMPSTATYSYGG